MRAAALALPIALSTACTHEHTVSTLQPHSASAAATAQLVDGRKVELRAASTPDGDRWFIQPTVVGAPWTPVDAPAIRSYTVARRGRGVFEGGVWGAIIGTGVGAALGAALGSAGGREAPCETDSCLINFSGPGFSAVLAAFYLGHLGIGVGSALGARIGSRDTYRVGPAAEPSQGLTRIVPVQNGAGVAWSF